MRTHPSLVAVLAVTVVSGAVGLVSRPFADYLWVGEESPVERAEVTLIVVCMAAWTYVATRLHRRGAARLPVVLAALMVVQLVFLLGEELDWGPLLGLHERNLRVASHAVFPKIIDSPLLATYLIAFFFAPLVPSARVRRFLERAAPVRAGRADAWAAFLGPISTLAILPIVGDFGVGELQEVTAYAVLAVLTVRITRRAATFTAPG